MPGELISYEVVRPFRIQSIHGNKCGLEFVDHCNNTVQLCYEIEGCVSKVVTTILDRLQRAVQTVQNV